MFALFAAVALAAGCVDDGPTVPTPVPPPVQPPPPTAVTLDTLSLRGPGWFAHDPTLEIGETIQLRAYAEYSDDTETDVTGDAAWRSSNSHVATVVAGLVTGRNAGGADVRMSYEGLEVRFAFRVESAPEPGPAEIHPACSSTRPHEHARRHVRARHTGPRNGRQDRWSRPKRPWTGSWRSRRCARVVLAPA